MRTGTRANPEDVNELTPGERETENVEQEEVIIAEITETEEEKVVLEAYEGSEEDNRENGYDLSEEEDEDTVGILIKTVTELSRTVNKMAVESKLQRTPGKTGKQKELDILPSHMAFKIYEKGLEGVRCKKIGDTTLFSAKRTWIRMIRDFPVSEKTSRRLLPLAFEGDARNVYEEVANESLDVNTTELWTRLEERLCNKVHQSELQDKLFDMKWNERKETFTTFAQRLRSASLALPTPIDKDILLNRLKAGIPSRLRDQAHIITGSYDEVVTRLGRLSAAQMPREGVREIVENKDGGMAERYATYLCHACGKRGHIARYCTVKREGNGLGGRPNPRQL